MAKVKLHGENAQKNIILYGVSFSITCLSILFKIGFSFYFDLYQETL